MPGAEPFLLHGNNGTGCLCLHGVSASPHEMRWFGEHLHGQGITTYGARLTGHGIHYKHLRHVHWQDWYSAALDGYHLLRSQCDRVFVAGLSMGGLLTLLLAANEPVDGLIVMASPLKLSSARTMRLARWIKYVRPFLHMPDRSDFPQRIQSTQRQRGDTIIGRVRYDHWATQAVEEVYNLMQVAGESLAQITAPALLMYAEKDQTVALDNLDYVRSRLSSQHIETEVLPRSGHILTQDYDHERVFVRAAGFINGP